MPPPVETFEPADYSLEELAFMREHLTESPNVALHGGVPRGVNPVAIRNALGRFSELDELQRVRKVPWAGFEAISDSIDRFIAFQEKCVTYQAQGEPRHPSQKTWDSTGAMSDGGIGSDSAEKVRTELREDGSRQTFTVPLVNTVRRSRVWGVKNAAAMASALTAPATAASRQPAAPRVVDAITYDNGTYTCTICNKAVASFDTDRGSRARNKARSEARKHCLKARKEVARHRAIVNVPVE
jgi:hypothetical protein